MVVYVVRRLVVSFFILLAATALVFWLVAVSGDPLEDLYADQSGNRETRIAERVRRLHLDEPVAQRYLRWLVGVSRCVVPGTRCDLGTTRSGQDVATLLSHAMGATLRLVLVATALAVVLGVGVGIVSALRQYSGFDYTVTFAAFLFFSLPLFWVAVLLKDFLAIGFNDWLADPRISPATMAVLSALSALTCWGLTGGEPRRRAVAAGAGFGGALAVLVYLSAVRWFAYPGLGPVVVTLLSLASAVGVTHLVSGLRRPGVLRAALASAALGALAQVPLGPLLRDPTWPVFAGLAMVTVAAGTALGHLLGGVDRPQARRAAVLVGLLTGGWVFLDHVLSSVHRYSLLVNRRVVATIGSGTPNFEGDFWERLIDAAAHLVLPTIAIMLISFASYSRYTRATMLEVMGQDYVRTARAKGLPERVVVLRHAFRNALIPVTTLMAIDFGAVVSGAVIAESVFGWDGMGSLFVTALAHQDPPPVMGFFVVTATSLVLFNLLADLAYAYLDPRIRMS